MIPVPFLSTFLKAVQSHPYDDASDRLNYYYTTILLLFFSILVSAGQYVGSPIQCWIPKEFQRGWEKFTEDYCFVKNTYYIPLHQDIPNDTEHRKDAEIKYYQWVPIVLAIQAALFYMPNIVWKTFCWRPGGPLDSILKTAKKCIEMEPEARTKELKQLSVLMEENLKNHPNQVYGFLRLHFKRHQGCYVNMLYILVKLLYVANVVGQFFLLNSFLGTKHRLWGIQIFQDMINGTGWEENGYFPRVTLCDFSIRKLGNVQPFTVQCVLMINLFNEKIYMFLWFWLVFISVASIGSLFYWILISVQQRSCAGLVETFVRLGSDEPVEKNLVRRFARDVLRPDGVLILRFVSDHAGDIASIGLAANLYKRYLQTSKCPPGEDGYADHTFYKGFRAPSPQLEHQSLGSTPKTGTTERSLNSSAEGDRQMMEFHRAPTLKRKAAPVAV